MKINVNGRDHTVKVDGNPNLLEVLREQLDLTGTKYGCGEGACGACKVLVNGTAVPACITPIVSVQDKNVVTVEGLETEGTLHPVQQAFLEEDVFQCGYCASGIVVSAVALIEKSSRPTKQEIMESMQANICRCCTYPQIISAIQRTANT